MWPGSRHLGGEVPALLTHRQRADRGYLFHRVGNKRWRANSMAEHGGSHEMTGMAEVESLTIKRNCLVEESNPTPSQRHDSKEVGLAWGLLNWQGPHRIVLRVKNWPVRTL